MKRDRVLVLRPHAATIGGVEHYYNVLALDLVDPRFEYFHVTQSSRETVLGIGARLLRLYVRYWRKLTTRAYGLVLLNPSLNRNSFYRDAAFCILARLAGSKVAVFFRGWSDDMESSIRRKWLPGLVFKLSFARVRSFIVLSDAFRRRLLQLGCDSGARFFVASTVADDSYLPRFDLERRLARSDRLRILFMSRLVPSKGAEIALRAFGLARERLPEFDLHLTIAGDGPDLPSLKTLAQELGISSVTLVGTVVGAAKGTALLENDVFLFPTSHGEGMPNVVLEAMLYGMPVLSRPVGGISDVIEHGVNGYLSDSLDPRCFADWIVELSTDPELRYRMSLANHRKALASYTTARVREHLIRIVDETLGGQVAPLRTAQE